MAGYGYNGLGGAYGGYGGANIQQGSTQERVGYGPQGYGLYEQELQVNRNPYTGTTTIVQENEFIPTGTRGYMGYGSGAGYGSGYGGTYGSGYGGGYGGGYGNRFI